MSSRVNYMEDDDDGDHNNPPSINRRILSSVELQEAFKESQLKEIQLEEKLRELNIRNAALESSNGGRGGKGKGQVPDTIASEVDKITKLGKKYCVLVSPWVSPSAFRQPRPSDVVLTGTSRYLDADTRDEAVIEELYQFLPDQYHTALEKLTKFGDIFRSGMSAMRSTAVYTLKPHCAVIFDTLDAKFFRTGFEKKNDETLKRLIGWDKKSGKISFWAPILFSDPDAKIDLRYAFRNKSLALILRVILFGASSLSATRRATPKTNGQIWGVTSVNDSAIAFSAILARFILSGDKEFVETGNSTNIDYLGDFWAYRQFLARASKAPHDALIKWYNERVFVDKSTAAPSTTREENEFDKILDDDIAAFNKGVTEEDVDDDGDRDQSSGSDENEDVSRGSSGNNHKSGDGGMMANTDDEDGAPPRRVQPTPRSSSVPLTNSSLINLPPQSRREQPTSRRESTPAISENPYLVRQATPRLSHLGPPPDLGEGNESQLGPVSNNDDDQSQRNPPVANKKKTSASPEASEETTQNNKGRKKNSRLNDTDQQTNRRSRRKAAVESDVDAET